MTDRPDRPEQPRPGHSSSVCTDARLDAAVALLSHREPSAAVMEHLQACPPCYLEYLDLAVLPQLLDAGREATMHPPAPADTGLLDRMLREVGRRRRRRRIFTAMAAAAAVVAVAVPVARLTAPGGSDPVSAPRSSSAAPSSPGGGPAAPLSASHTDPGTGAGMQVTVEAHGTGSLLTVSVSGVKAGDMCRLMVHDDAGAVVLAGRWTVSARYDSSPYMEDVQIRPEHVRRIELLDDRTGRRLVEVPFGRV